MDRQAVLLVHGFASSGQSTKAAFFRTRFNPLSRVEFHAIDMHPTPLDFEYMTITGQINRLRQYILDYDLEPLCLIGSSLGGLVSLHYAHRFGRIERMLLLAPMTMMHPGWAREEELEHWRKAGVVPIFHYAFQRELPLRYAFYSDGLLFRQPVPPVAPTLIVHGRNDEAIPINDSRAYATEFADQVHLIEVDAGHDLNDHLPFIWEQGCPFLLERSGTAS
jgi:pimeloyl-ACP methyl ester carboxylesterase